MGFPEAVQWWEDWQLRILVLGSLGVQCYLAIFGNHRKSPIPSWHKLFIWLSYLGSDALAIYGLATLFNRRKKLHYNDPVDGRHVLEVLWAPILLMHLGGQVSITAYDIEDNELWKRHILTSASQVSVAVYVFFKSWSLSADKRLLASAILLFIAGIFKCAEKPWALKSATFYNLVSHAHPKSHHPRTLDAEVQLEEYIQRARIFVQHHNPPRHGPQSPYWWRHNKPRYLFKDMAHPYPHRRHIFMEFWLLDENKVCKALGEGLSDFFDILYTKSVLIGAKGSSVLVCALHTRLFAIAFPTAAIVLFHCSHKEAYLHRDVIVTFMLLYITLLLEASSLVSLSCARWVWPDMVAQHSLVRFFIRNKRHAWFVSIAGWFRCKDILYQYWSMYPCYSSRIITSLALGHVKGGWINYILDAETLRKFGDLRGQWTLERNGCEQILGGSLEAPFDESIVLWHVATHFCFHHKGTSAGADSANSLVCTQISNYMMHLLFVNPEMLMPGSRPNLFTSAYEEIENILHGEDLLLADEKKLTEKISDKVDPKNQGFIYDGWMLAQGLMQLGDDKKMWEVIQGVWVEMLCFSAGRCRGFLHAKSLGSGGEFLSYIWLLMAHAGLETFPEKQQRIRLRLPKEVRQHIVRIRSMKEEIEKAANIKKQRSKAAGASAEVEIVVSKR